MRPAFILLVEPHDDTRNMYAEYLRLQNVTCVTAITTDAALACSTRADAVVTGIRVPGSFDGIELVRRLRLSAATTQMPIIVLSAGVFERDQRQAFNAGCDVFLLKPCAPDQLVSELHHLLARRAVGNGGGAWVSDHATRSSRLETANGDRPRPSSESLVTRIRAEFREMPGLRLTFAQACRFWHLEPAECERVLDTLQEQEFLHRTAEGVFVCRAEAHRTPARGAGMNRKARLRSQTRRQGSA